MKILIFGLSTVCLVVIGALVVTSFCGINEAETNFSNSEANKIANHDTVGITVGRTVHPMDMAGFCEVLANEVAAGDSIESVQKLLGPGMPLNQEQHNRIVQAVLNWQSTDPDIYPSGSLGSDKFQRWSIPEGCTLQLQFRDGRLINHAPKSYLAYLKEMNAE